MNAPIQNLDHNTAAEVPNRASRPWEVLHTCNHISEIADIVMGELAVGMRPGVVTPDGVALFADALRDSDQSRDVQISLLNTWNDVRHWRKVILDADPLSEFDLIHAHSFAAGMAGVRNCPATVYDIDQFVEDFASGVAARSSEHTSWLSRSFRVAEQFILLRAAAVVVRTESIRQAAIHRGSEAENTFAVPRVINRDEPPRATFDQSWLQAHGIDSERDVVAYAPGWTMELSPDGALSHHSQGLLRAFGLAADAHATSIIFLVCPDSVAREVREMAGQLNIATRVKLISADDHQRAFDAASVVIVDSDSSISNTPHPNPSASAALIASKTLLAADLPCNRDVTPDGRGCLWYRSGDYKDVGHRMAYLMSNQDFRESLADSGHRYLIETCSPTAVAMQYDRIYRHAAARRRSGGLQTPAIRLTPASATL